jgi:hypothetical protein
VTQTIDPFFWQDPPWSEGKPKYRLGLQPIPNPEWLNNKINPSLYKHKKNLLDASYNKVVATIDGSEEAQNILNNFIKANTKNYPDLIADMSLMIQDDLCIVRSDGDQELIAACVCSPSYWDVQSKIGKSLHNIHGPVSTLNEKIGERISKFIRQSPVMKPFKRQNWLVHGDIDRFHLTEEGDLNPNPKTWFIRSEKETLCRFHETYSLFTINLMFQPLQAIFKFPKAKNDLIESIRTFDDDEIEYFGGKKKIRILQNYLLGKL